MKTNHKKELKSLIEKRAELKALTADVRKIEAGLKAVATEQEISGKTYLVLPDGVPIYRVDSTSPDWKVSLETTPATAWRKLTAKLNGHTPDLLKLNVPNVAKNSQAQEALVEAGFIQQEPGNREVFVGDKEVS